MKVKCTNCGGDVPISEKTTTAVCPFCKTSLFVELTKGVPHSVYKKHLDTNAAKSLLIGFLQKHEITGSVTLKKQTTTYVPYWRLKNSDGVNFLAAASEPPSEDMTVIKEHAGTLSGFDEMNFGSAKVQEPQILINEAAAGANVSGIVLKEDEAVAALLYLPVLCVEYILHDEPYMAFINAVSGSVYTDKLPESPQREKSRSMALVALISFLIFFVQMYKLPGSLLWLTFPLSAIGLYYVLLTALKRMGW